MSKVDSDVVEDEVPTEPEQKIVEPTTSTYIAPAIAPQLRGFDFVVSSEHSSYPRDWTAVKDFTGDNYLPKIATIIHKECESAGVPTTSPSLPIMTTSSLRSMFKEAGADLVVDHGSMVFRGTGRFAASHIAAKLNQTNVLDLLLSNKASLEAPDILNWTPLHYAASYLSVSSLKLLLSEKANPNALSSSSSDRQSPILRVSTAQPALLIGEGKPFKTRSQFDSAVESCLEELLDKGADIEYEDSRKRSILHLASSSGNDKAVEIVLEKGFVVNSPCDADGNTPLHFACLYDRPTTVSLLINKGADVNAKNKEGKTPADVAIGDAILALKGEYTPPDDDDRSDCCTVV